MLINQTEWPKNPKIYEINTWPWLNSLSETYSKPITLENIPDEILDQEISLFDAVWFMGVWERSPASKKIALQHPDLQQEYHRALYDYREQDVVGSPYAVYYYHVDKNIGGIDGLKNIRKRLAERDIRIILDYVPNHVSVDSLWTLESNLFIEGTTEDLMSHPYDFFSISDKVFAHGKDPNFAAWTDTIQINSFSQEARQKTKNTLLNIAELSDGVRCDMAMLMTNDVFRRTWGERAGPIPKNEFWSDVIPSLKSNFPDFLFIAEVYWDMEWELQQQGFDFCYDKRLYERLTHENASTIKDHLKAELDYQSKLVRFIENHDELRAIDKFGEERSRAAAAIALTLPGARLVYEGQTNGYKLKLPVQLGRWPSEEKNKNLHKFYHDLLKSMPSIIFENANWSLCEAQPVSYEDSSNSNIISYLWKSSDFIRLIIVNFSPFPSKAHITSEKLNYGDGNWTFTDLLIQRDFTYSGEDLSKFGLYIELSGWNTHIFNIKKYE